MEYGQFSYRWKESQILASWQQDSTREIDVPLIENAANVLLPFLIHYCRFNSPSYDLNFTFSDLATADPLVNSSRHLKKSVHSTLLRVATLRTISYLTSTVRAEQEQQELPIMTTKDEKQELVFKCFDEDFADGDTHTSNDDFMSEYEKLQNEKSTSLPITHGPRPIEPKPPEKDIYDLYQLSNLQDTKNKLINFNLINKINNNNLEMIQDVTQIKITKCTRCEELNHKKKDCCALQCFVCNKINEHKVNDCPMVRCPFCQDRSMHTVPNCHLVTANKFFYSSCACGKKGHRIQDCQETTFRYNDLQTRILQTLLEKSQRQTNVENAQLAVNNGIGNRDNHNTALENANGQLANAELRLQGLRSELSVNFATSYYVSYTDIVAKTLKTLIYLAQKKKKKKKNFKNYQPRGAYRGRGRGRGNRGNYRGRGGNEFWNQRNYY